jgi:type IV pilus assembly protein PilE
VKHTKAGGFTLIELMIVVAVIGVLAAIAFPSYQEQVRKSHRTDAQTAMLELAQRLERCFTLANTYVGCPTVQNIPSGRYTITAVPTAAGFTISAVPEGGQSKDICKTMTLDHRGTRGPASPASCWN